jgi:hypothetical protein
VDLSLSKKLRISERMNVQFQAQAFNLLNHPQFTPGFPDSVRPTTGSNGYTVSRAVLEPRASTFNQDQNFFTSHARTLQLGLKFQF